jgi:hypothetical protein
MALAALSVWVLLLTLATGQLLEGRPLVQTPGTPSEEELPTSHHKTALRTKPTPLFT